MTDLLIGQCDLRIRRPAGTAAPWLGDDDQKALAGRVQAIVLPMLEELLAPRLAQHAEFQGSDLRLQLRLGAGDLAGVAPLARPGLRSRLAASVEAALEEAEAGSRLTPLPPRPLVAKGGATPTSEQPQPLFDSVRELIPFLEHLFATIAAESALLLLPERALLQLLERVLRTIPGPQSLALRHGLRLLGESEDQADTPSWSPERQEIIAALKRLVRALPPSENPTAAATASARELTAAIASARDLISRRETEPWIAEAGHWRRTSRGTSDNEETLARREGSCKDSPDVGDPRNPQEQTKQPQKDSRPYLQPVHAEAAGTGVAGLATGRYFLDHALPFVAIAALARHGISEALALDAPDPVVCRALVTAMALKSLPPRSAQDPGAWSESARRAAAFAAGLDGTPHGATFTAAAARVTDSGAFARAGVAAALIESLHPAGTLPLVAAGQRLVLFDPGGFYPVAAHTPQALLPLLRTLGRTFFLAPFDPALWPLLDDAGLAVVADSPALTAERSHTIAGPGGWRGHATATTRLSPGLRARLPQEAATALRAAEVWRALGRDAELVARPAADVRTHAFDELAALLAGFALADIGWALFRRDPASWTEPDPLLVRSRFADLSGWLEVGTSRINIALPMGRRFTDLRDAGFLDTLRPLPWWPGREIGFRGG